MNWLAGDGETILESDVRLDTILGCKMQSEKLSEHCPSSELERLRSSLKCESSDSLVRLLPTSLLRLPSLTELNVDLFIVDRRQACNADMKCSQRSYLIGVRLHSGGAVNESVYEPESDLDVEAATSSELPSQEILEL